MYDSDEVRDAVRREGVIGLIFRWPDGGPSPEEHAVVLDAWKAAQAEWQARQAKVTEVIRQFCDAVKELGEAICRALVEGLAPVAAGVAEAFQELAERIGIIHREMPQPMPWARRPRKPEIRPVRLVDAVAAGRHPAMIFRTKIRGGRR